MATPKIFALEIVVHVDIHIDFNLHRNHTVQLQILHHH